MGTLPAEMPTLQFGSILEFNSFPLIFLITAFLGSCYGDIVGCGGFLKSQVVIDFSLVEVKLYTKQGTLKESSDCAPTNGYYFIPIYDKGEYLLKIEPPSDWYFEPKEVLLNFDGINDPCSKGNDINFIFKGFSVHGKVISTGTSEGPENVVVNLLSETDKSLNLKTTTNKAGYFQFSPILPGHYLITAKDEKYTFYKNSVRITVTDRTLQVPLGSLQIAGYDVIGQVLFNGEPTKGVTFVLSASDKMNSNTRIEDCSKSPLADFKHKDYLCHLNSNENGIFHFKTIPPGRYVIRPHYVKFDVQPKEMNIVIKHSHLTLGEKFLVKGFSVNGRVLTSLDGLGIPKAEIFLNGKKIAETNEDGKYTVDGMEPGNYVLSVQSENVKYQEKKVKVSPNTPEIETIYPSEFRVCGSVIPLSGQQHPRVVEIEQIDPPGKLIEVAVDRATGKFCHFLTPALYNMKVKISELEKSNGLQYLPLVKEVLVKNKPFTDIQFTQLRGNIKGNIRKLPDSPEAVELSVKLKLKNSLVALKILEGPSLSYGFDDVMPGYYDVEMENNQWCFQNHVHSISVNAAETVVPDFVQTGFKVRIASSHKTVVMVTSISSEEKDFKLLVELEKGENTICLPRFTKYKVVPLGCYGYEKEFYTIDPKEGKPLILNAVLYDVTGFIKIPLSEEDLAVDVVLSNGKTSRLELVEGEKDSSGFVHKFTYKSEENQLLKFIPISTNLMFQPDFLEFRTINDCSINAVQFTGEKGLIVEGRIKPPLDNVKVTLKTKKSDSEETEIVFFTQTDGIYKFGPLKNTTNYEIVAEKESYILTGPDENGIIKSHKLAEINVKVVDNATGEPLQGVLLSLTGGEKYRKNSMTGEAGSLSFYSLSPGEYFLRPMMKEYKFNPSSQIIEIKEGVTKFIELRGRRVSFSTYGIVMSLNGEPESNVVVEAIGMNTCSNFQEEAASESNGQFRIRGLLPQCEYKIQLKEGPEVNAQIQRVAPSDFIVKTSDGDVRNIQLTALHFIDQMDILVHVESTVPEHLKTLKLKLCKESSPDSPVYAVRLDSLAGGAKHWGTPVVQERFLKAGILVQLPFIPLDKTPYFIQIESSLNKHTFSYKEPTVHFISDKTYKSFKLTFDPVLKMLDHELSQKNYIIVPLIIFAGIVYTYFNKALPVFQNIFGTLNQTSFSFGREERIAYAHNNLADGLTAEPVGISVKRKTKPRRT